MTIETNSEVPTAVAPEAAPVTVGGAGASAPAAVPLTLDQLKTDPAFLAALNNPYQAGPAATAARAQWAAAQLEAFGSPEAKAAAAQDNAGTRRTEDAGFAPPDDIASYKMEPLRGGLAAGLDDAPSEVVDAARTVFAAAGLDVETGHYLVQAFNTIQLQENRGEPVLTEASAMQGLVARHGQERAAAMVKVGNDFINALPAAQRDQAKRFLRAGPGNHVGSIERIISFIENRKGAPKRAARN